MQYNKLFTGIMAAALAATVAVASSYGQGASKGAVLSIKEGRLERFENGIWKSLKNGQPLNHGDRLRTDQSGLAVIDMPPAGKFILGPSTEAELGKDVRSYTTKLTRGALWQKAELPKGSKAFISTSLGTAGIRGTKFSVLFNGKWMYVCSCKGDLEVTAPDQTKIVNPSGYFTDIASGKPMPDRARSGDIILLKEGEGSSEKFDFCFNCHVAGRKGKVKRIFEGL